MVATSLLAVLALFPATTSAQGTKAFRVLPYLQSPHNDTLFITWFTTQDSPATLTLTSPDTPSWETTIAPRPMDVLAYHEIEENERADFPDMFTGQTYKYSSRLRGLKPDTTYTYTVEIGSSRYQNTFRTAPTADTTKPIKIIAIADCETDPEGRQTYRTWAPGTQHPDSIGRPTGQENYLVTETQGFIENLKFIRQANPQFIMLAGDIVQGAGYQRAWDEFFFHTAGKFDDILGKYPLLPAIGNWENFGARVGGYEPWAIHLARNKYTAYFDAPANNVPEYEGFYYRSDIGPVTVITLDSSNGLPDNTDNDTNKNIDAELYPGNNLADLAPGSPQWNWCIEQLADARAQGQLIIVQFHHVPYSSGGHSLPTTLADSSGQAGLPMRMYFPYFQKYGVAAVITGHNESFERSEIGGIQVYDVGVAGDGIGRPIDDVDPRRLNPWRKWVAHVDSAEHWQGKKLVDGGKHYGHLEMIITPSAKDFKVEFIPVYSFPVTDDQGQVTGFERRIYNDRFTVTYPRNRGPIKIPVPGPNGG